MLPRSTSAIGTALRFQSEYAFRHFYTITARCRADHARMATLVCRPLLDHSHVAELVHRGLADTGHFIQIGDAFERAIGLPIFDNPRSRYLANAGQLLQLFGAGRVDVGFAADGNLWRAWYGIGACLAVWSQRVTC